MIDRDAFLKTIFANPKADGPRLVYADWLEDNGEAERAELIRIQIELSACELTQFGCDGSGERSGARHSHPGKIGQTIHGILHDVDPRKPHHHHDERCHDPRPGLLHRAAELLQRNLEWSYPFAKIFIPNDDCRPYIEYGYGGCADGLSGIPGTLGTISWEWNRGFIDSISLTQHQWGDGIGILAVAPITKVRIVGVMSLRFSPAQVTEQPDPKHGGVILTAKWYVDNGERIERFYRQYVITQRTPESERRYFDELIAADRTIRGYLRSKWPGIEFTLPDEGRTVNERRAIRGLQPWPSETFIGTS